MTALPRFLQTLRLVAMTTLLGGAAFAAATAAGQESDDAWEVQVPVPGISYRGLCVVDDSIVWASGTGGMVVTTSNGGKSWSQVPVEGAEELDFRDIHAWNAKEAVVVSAGTPARFYRTEDGGTSWTLAWEHPRAEAFFDALSFWNDGEGIAMSDPLDGRIVLARTADRGRSWTELPREQRPEALPGEGGFAASGTNMILLPDGTCLLALGSAPEGERLPESRILRSADRGKSWSAVTAPIPRSPSAGIFSMAFRDLRHGVAVGGDYLDPDVADDHLLVTEDGGLTWSVPNGTPPRGYRSGVAARGSAADAIWVAVGPSGSDLSRDDGQNWEPLSRIPLHAIRFSPSAQTGWATGPDGRIARWRLDAGQ